MIIFGSSEDLFAGAPIFLENIKDLYVCGAFKFSIPFVISFPFFCEGRGVGGGTGENRPVNNYIT